MSDINNDHFDEQLSTSESGHKLTTAGRRFLVERLIAGDTNAVARRALIEAGYATITNQAVSKYRKDSRVIQGIALLDDETRQVGLLMRSRRLLSLNEAGAMLIGHIRDPKTHPTAAAVVVTAFVRVCQEIARLTEPAARVTGWPGASTDDGTPPTDPFSKASILGMFLDALEEATAKAEVDAAAKASAIPAHFASEED